jgi:hypothetical protein
LFDYGIFGRDSYDHFSMKFLEHVTFLRFRKNGTEKHVVVSDFKEQLLIHLIFCLKFLNKISKEHSFALKLFNYSMFDQTMNGIDD